MSRTALHLHLWMTTALLAATERLTRRRPAAEGDRGDVPGWVMITVMTAIMVIALLGVFRTQVVAAVQHAFNSVSGAANG